MAFSFLVFLAFVSSLQSTTLASFSSPTPESLFGEKIENRKKNSGLSGDATGESDIVGACRSVGREQELTLELGKV